MAATAIDTEKTQETAENLADRLPVPAGYKMLVIKPEIEEKSEGGIVYANFVTTVSPRYAWEIQHTALGMGLQQTLQSSPACVYV